MVAEKNRLQGPRAQLIKDSCTKMIKTISEHIESITKKIDEIIEGDEILRAKKATLQSISGIGRIVSNELVVLLPELGGLNRRQIASLVGVHLWQMIVVGIVDIGV